MNLTLHLTDNCNMDCSYCIREKCPKDMSEEVLYKACDLAFSKGTRAGLCFFGGEPLLKKDLIFKALDYCEKKAAETGIRFDCKMTSIPANIVRSIARYCFQLLFFPTSSPQ